MHLEAEDTLEGRRCIRRRRRRRKQKQSSRWKGVAEGGSPYKDVEAEVALLRPVSGFSATSAGVGSGFGLSCCVYAHRDRIAWGRV